MDIGYLQRGATRISYRVAGEGPAVLFLHAGVCDSRMWSGQMGLDGFRTVAFDRRGFGQTPIGDEPFADEADAVAVLDHLDVDEAVVVGCSMGGAIALALARNHEERVRGLVLVGADAPGFQPGQRWESPEWPQAVEAFNAGDLEEVARLDAEIWLAGKDRTVDGIDAEVLDLFLDMDRMALQHEATRDNLLRPPRLDGTPAPAPPTLVIVGEHDLPQLIEAAQYLAENLSDRPPVILEDTAHIPSLERPEEFNRVLSGFLRSL